MEIGPGFTATYTDFDLPQTMTSTAAGGTSASFSYDAMGERVVKDEPGVARTTYVHGLFERRQAKRSSSP